MTIGAIKNFITAYMRRTTAADLVLNTTVDIALIAINTARRKVENAHDF